MFQEYEFIYCQISKLTYDMTRKNHCSLILNQTEYWGRGAPKKCISLFEQINMCIGRGNTKQVAQKYYDILVGTPVSSKTISTNKISADFITLMYIRLASMSIY